MMIKGKFEREEAEGSYLVEHMWEARKLSCGT